MSLLHDLRDSLADFRHYLADFALFWPGIIVSIALSIAFGRRLGAALGTSRTVATMLILGGGLIASATLTPSREALTQGAVGTGICDLSRLWPASVGELLRFEDPTFNVLLFAPLGLAIGLLPPSRRKAVLIMGAFALPFAIETIQLLATQLGRGCQSSDVADNVTGLVIGLVLGIVAGRLAPPAMRRNLERSAPEA